MLNFRIGTHLRARRNVHGTLTGHRPQVADRDRQQTKARPLSVAGACAHTSHELQQFQNLLMALKVHGRPNSFAATPYRHCSVVLFAPLQQFEDSKLQMRVGRRHQRSMVLPIVCIQRVPRNNVLTAFRTNSVPHVPTTRGAIDVE